MMERILGSGNVRTVLLILVVIELAVILSLARKYLLFNTNASKDGPVPLAKKMLLLRNVTSTVSKLQRRRTTNVGYSRGFVPRSLTIPVTKGPVIKLWKDTMPNLPEESTVPRIVHQLLTSDTLKFRNYLSILSVKKLLQPYRIILHVPNSFEPKQYGYNRWFQKAISKIPNLEAVDSVEADKLGDKLNVTEELQFAASLLDKVGGVYVNLNTVINFNPWTSGKDAFQIGFHGNASLGFIFMPRAYDIVKFARTFKLSENELFKHRCVGSESYTGSESCCRIENDIFPVNIMRLKSSFGAFTRSLYYGSKAIPEPKRAFPPIPKIVHYVWFGHRNVSFSMYVSFKSTLRFVKPLKIIIYVERYNLGPYFDAMRNHGEVQVVYYGAPKSAFQNRIKTPKHASDFLRTDVLLRFGGIYMDWDVFWLKPIDDLIELGYETIAAFEHYNGMTPREEFPDTINMGVVLARPGSRFIKLWQESFRDYTGEHATFHAIEMVYKIYEEHPDLLYIEKKLQVMCFKLRCHPLWLPNYKDTSVHNEFAFKNTAYAVHFTEPVPIAFMSEDDMRNSKGYFADMARHAYGAM